jgi:hypothetical protein
MSGKEKRATTGIVWAFATIGVTGLLLALFLPDATIGGPPPIAETRVLIARAYVLTGIVGLAVAMAAVIIWRRWWRAG